ncbi:hypothetical protein ACO0QE_001546 [Hanseniaspora vineae]
MAKKTKKGRSSNQNGNKGNKKNGINGKSNTTNKMTNGVDNENKQLIEDTALQPSKPEMSKAEMEQLEEVQRRNKLQELAKKNSVVDDANIDIQELRKYISIDQDKECAKLFIGKPRLHTLPVVNVKLCSWKKGKDDQFENIPNTKITYKTPENTHIITFCTTDFVLNDENGNEKNEDHRRLFFANEILGNPFGKSITECIDMLRLVLNLFLFHTNGFSVKLVQKLTNKTLTIHNYNTAMTLQKNQNKNEEDEADPKEKVAVDQREIRQKYCRLHNVDAKQHLLTWQQFKTFLQTLTESPNLCDEEELFLERMSQWIIYNGVGNESLQKDLIQDKEYNAFSELFQSSKNHQTIIQFILGDFLKYCMTVRSTIGIVENEISKWNGHAYERDDLLITNVLRSLNSNIHFQSFQQHNTNAIAKLDSFNNYLNTTLSFNYNFMNFLILSPTPNIFFQMYYLLHAEYAKTEDEIDGEEMSELSITNEQKQQSSVKSEETDVFQDLYKEEDVFDLHNIILNALFPKDTTIKHPLTRKIASVLISLADPKTQPLPTDTRIVSIDYLTDCFLGSLWSFYMFDQCTGGGPQQENMYFRLSVLLIDIIKATLPLLKLDLPEKGFDEEFLESAFDELDENWKANYAKWFPCDTDLRTLEILYMVNILATFAIFKLTLATEKVCGIHYKISPFSVFFIKLWSFQSFQIYYGISIDQHEEFKMTCETPNIVKAVIRGNTAWRCVNALLINTSDSAFSNNDGETMENYYTLVKHDYEHEPFNSFMSPHGRKLSTGALTFKEMKYEILTSLYTQETPFIIPEDTQDSTITNNKENTETDANSVDFPYTHMQNNLTELFPWPTFYADAYDGEARYMFDWEYDLYNEPEVSEPEKIAENHANHDGNSGNKTPTDKEHQELEKSSHPGVPRCYCVIDAYPDEERGVLDEEVYKELTNKQMEGMWNEETKLVTKGEVCPPGDSQETDYDLITFVTSVGAPPHTRLSYDESLFERRFVTSQNWEPLHKVSATPEIFREPKDSITYNYRACHYYREYVWNMIQCLKEPETCEILNMQRHILEILYAFHQHLTETSAAQWLSEIRAYLKWFLIKNTALLFHLFIKPTTRNFAVILLNKLLEDPVNYPVLKTMILECTTADFHFLSFVLQTFASDSFPINKNIPNFGFSSLKISLHLTKKQCFECLTNVLLNTVSIHFREHATYTKNCALMSKMVADTLIMISKQPKTIAHKAFLECVQPYSSAFESSQHNSENGFSEATKAQNFLAALFSFQYQLNECLSENDRHFIFELYSALVSLLGNPKWDQIVADDHLSNSNVELKNTTETLQHLALDKDCFVDFCKKFEIFSVDTKEKSLVHPYEHKNGVKPLATPLSCSLESYLALANSH